METREGASTNKQTNKQKSCIWKLWLLKDLGEAVIYYIIFKGQSPILEALHRKEKDHSLVSLRTAKAVQTN